VPQSFSLVTKDLQRASTEPVHGRAANKNHLRPRGKNDLAGSGGLKRRMRKKAAPDYGALARILLPAAAGGGLGYYLGGGRGAVLGALAGGGAGYVAPEAIKRIQGIFAGSPDPAGGSSPAAGGAGIPDAVKERLKTLSPQESQMLEQVPQGRLNAIKNKPDDEKAESVDRLLRDLERDSAELNRIDAEEEAAHTETMANLDAISANAKADAETATMLGLAGFPLALAGERIPYAGRFAGPAVSGLSSLYSTSTLGDAAVNAAAEESKRVDRAVESDERRRGVYRKYGLDVPPTITKAQAKDLKSQLRRMALEDPTGTLGMTAGEELDAMRQGMSVGGIPGTGEALTGLSLGLQYNPGTATAMAPVNLASDIGRKLGKGYQALQASRKGMGEGLGGAAANLQHAMARSEGEAFGGATEREMASYGTPLAAVATAHRAFTQPITAVQAIGTGIGDTMAAQETAAQQEAIIPSVVSRTNAVLDLAAQGQRLVEGGPRMTAPGKMFSAPGSVPYHYKQKDPLWRTKVDWDRFGTPEDVWVHQTAQELKNNPEVLARVLYGKQPKPQSFWDLF
jgi:hypothetical protein